MNQVNQTVMHSQYGLCLVNYVFQPAVAKTGTVIQSKALRLELLTDEGKSAYRYDRGGILPYLFEDDFAKIKSI